MSDHGKVNPDPFATIREDITMGRPVSPKLNTRFRPGQSGNPRGRPRKALSDAVSLADQPTKLAFLKANRQTLKVREGDRITEIDRGTALIQAAQQTALKGSPYLLHRLLELNMKLEKEQAREQQESRRFWTDYKESRYELLKAERAGGQRVSEFLPHPDDIIIPTSGDVRIVGPLDKAGQKSVEHTIAMRDLLFLQEAWDYKSQPVPRLSRDRFMGSAKLLAFTLDQCLPPRLRLTEAKWCLKDNRAFGTSKRELLKLLYRGWRELGQPRARGYRFE